MRWYKGPHLVRNSKYYKTFVTDNVCTLVIRQVLLEDEGEYRCVGKNPHGEASDSAYVRVVGTFRLYSKPDSAQLFCPLTFLA